jgi:hypothetical protein
MAGKKLRKCCFHARHAPEYHEIANGYGRK